MFRVFHSPQFPTVLLHGLDMFMHIVLSQLWPLAGCCHCWDAELTGPFGWVLFCLIRLERAYSVVSVLKTGGIKQPASPPSAHMNFSSPHARRQEPMASIKKSVESLKGTSHSAAQGVTDTAGKAKSTLGKHVWLWRSHSNVHLPCVSIIQFCNGSQYTVCFYHGWYKPLQNS